MGRSIERRLDDLGLELPPPFAPVATYLPWVAADHLVHVSGQGPVWGSEVRFKGKLGRDLDLADGRRAAELTLLNVLSHAREACGGELERITRCVKLFGLVNCVSGYAEPHLVIDAASELLVRLYGARGRHARTVVGAPSLPFDIAVEIEAVFEVA